MQETILHEHAQTLTYHTWWTKSIRYLCIQQRCREIFMATQARLQEFTETCSLLITIINKLLAWATDNFAYAFMHFSLSCNKLSRSRHYTNNSILFFALQWLCYLGKLVHYNNHNYINEKLNIVHHYRVWVLITQCIFYSKIDYSVWNY